MKKIVFVLMSITFISCINEKEGIDIECVKKELVRLDIKADIFHKENDLEISLKKIYKTVDEGHQKLLVDNLIYKCIEVNRDLSIIVYLDKERDIKKSSFNYSLSEISEIKEEYSKRKHLRNMHGYILENFDKKDIFYMDGVLKKIYHLYEYKDDIYNLNFIDLLDKFEKEVSDKKVGKAGLTLLLTYGTYKDNKTFELINIGKHIRGIWELVNRKNIDVYLNEVFGD